MMAAAARLGFTVHPYDVTAGPAAFYSGCEYMASILWNDNRINV